MRARILTIALLIAIAALPVPASQVLAEPFSASAPGTVATATSRLATLLEDPFLAARLTFSAPRSFLDTETGVAPQTLRS
jgi:hypothetical protein